MDHKISVGSLNSHRQGRAAFAPSLRKFEKFPALTLQNSPSKHGVETQRPSVKGTAFGSEEPETTISVVLNPITYQPEYKVSPRSIFRSSWDQTNQNFLLKPAMRSMERLNNKSINDSGRVSTADVQNQEDQLRLPAQSTRTLITSGEMKFTSFNKDSEKDTKVKKKSSSNVIAKQLSRRQGFLR